MSLFDKVKSGVETAQNFTKKVGEVRDTFSTRATQIDNSEAEKVLENILLDNEKVEQSYRGLRDLLVFTDKRLIVIDIQGISGKKKQYLSIPYKSIHHFAIETAGLIDLDAELKLFGSSGTLITEFSFGKHAPIFEVQKQLAKTIL